MKTLDHKPLLFLGDNHGNWYELDFIIKTKNISDVNIISVGDLGIGFHPSLDTKTCNFLNGEFKERNINFYGIRGNHDDPSYFLGSKRICLSNFELIADYTIAKHQDKTLQFIGGAISIDRTGRTEGMSYWQDEGVSFKKLECKEVDVLVTHTAPSFCFPQAFNDIVYGWAKQDASLLKELANERKVMDKIFKLCKPKFHFYGHFHSAWTEEINGCKHKLLNIDELFSLQ